MKISKDLFFWFLSLFVCGRNILFIRKGHRVQSKCVAVSPTVDWWVDTTAHLLPLTASCVEPFPQSPCSLSFGKLWASTKLWAMMIESFKFREASALVPRGRETEIVWCGADSETQTFLLLSVFWRMLWFLVLLLGASETDPKGSLSIQKTSRPYDTHNAKCTPMLFANTYFKNIFWPDTLYCCQRDEGIIEK